MPPPNSANEIDFYFDFISPYAYFASRKIEGVAARHGKTVRWRPFRLGVTVVKVMGLKPVGEIPLKAPYLGRDIQRLATIFDIPFRASGMPNPIPPARLFYGAPAAIAPRLAKLLLQTHWGEGRNIGEESTLVQVGMECGMSEEDVQRALTVPETKLALTEQTNEAIARGVFGSPTVAVGDELFWGFDRLGLVDHYLKNDAKYVALSEETFSHFA